MSRRAKLFTLLLLLVLVVLFVIGHQLRWMPAPPLEFRIVEVRPESSITTTDTNTTDPGETYATVIVEVTNHASATIVLRSVDVVIVPLDELEGTLTGGPSMPVYLSYFTEDALGCVRQENTVPEGQTIRMEMHKVWLPSWQRATQRNVIYRWQTSPRHRCEKLMRWLWKPLPKRVPIWRIIPNEATSAAPLK